MKTAMDDPAVGATCPIALDGEAVAAYSAGRLGESEAEAFEQHFFACEDCWALVRAATAARASFAGTGEASAGTAPAVRPRRRWAVWLPAAGLAAAVAGLALFGDWSADAPTPPGEVFRGAEQAMSLEAAVEGETVRTSWEPVAGAAGYELRAYDASGRLLSASEVDAQTVAVDLDMLSLGGVPSVAALDVVALDGLGQVLLRSARVAVRP